jgi:hypothetical protein
LIRSRSVDLVQGSDHRWRELLDSADVMSEGAVRREPEGLTYYGSTSVLLPFSSKGGRIPDRDAERVARVLGSDPHVRLRAVRIACREACLRARASLGKVSAEAFVRTERRGIRLDIEVQAIVLEESRGRRPKAGGLARGLQGVGTGRR